MVTPAAKREAVAHLRSAFDMSERRACRTIGCVRMTMRYRCRRPDDAALRQRLRALAHERRRFGYRRLHVLLRREGFTVNHKRLFRLYREERLMVRLRRGRKRALGTRAPMPVPQWPNDRWSLDFVSDQFIDGRRRRSFGMGRFTSPRDEMTSLHSMQRPARLNGSTGRMRGNKSVSHATVASPYTMGWSSSA